MTVGVSAFGAYLPRFRLSRRAVADANGWFSPGIKSLGKGERAVANWDEDALTMAVEAARDCLGERPRDRLQALYFASTTHPFDDRQNSAIAAEALGIPGGISALDIAASQRAGTSGLIAALQAVGSAGGPILVLASEQRRARPSSVQEMTYGDGAAALLVSGEPSAARYVGGHSETLDFVDHYRGSGQELDYAWEERWIRDEGYLKIVPRTLAALFEKTGIDPSRVTHFCFPSALPRAGDRVAELAGLAPGSRRDNLQGACGEAGAAHPLLMLAHALEEAKPGDLILAVGFGQGCDALLFEVSVNIAAAQPRQGVKGSLARRREELNYARYLALNELIPVERGMRAEVDKWTAMTTLYRNRRMLLGMIGGACGVCGTAQFPKSSVCVNPNCNAIGTQREHSFAELAGKAVSYTADRLTYTPDPPAYYGMVQFAGGGRLMMDFTDVAPEALSVGMKMRMTFRIKDRDPARNFTRYFWKAAPLAAAEGDF
jgi:3-hydroxy-3-methylglutaryl CoA synthase